MKPTPGGIEPSPVSPSDTRALRRAESTFLCASADQRRGSFGRAERRIFLDRPELSRIRNVT